MIVHVARYKKGEKVSWGVVDNGLIYPMSENYSSTREFIKYGAENAKEMARFLASQSQDLISEPITNVELLSPITKPCQIVCQAINYTDHMIDSGIDPTKVNFNTFFSKSSASITGPTHPVVRPKHVQLLDYELELGLIIGRTIDQELTVSANNLHEFVAGIVIGNDVSARDIQLPQGQYFKGKSYRTFCPMGPYLCLLDKEDMHVINDLQLTLSVNGKIRQSGNTNNLVYKAEETLQELSQICDLSEGDVVLTGTPSGTAVKAPKSKLLLLVSRLIPESTKWRLLIKKQLKNPNYLQPGDKITATIRALNGGVDLGTQENIVTEA